MMTDFGDRVSVKGLQMDNVVKIMRGSISIEETLKAFGSQKTTNFDASPII